MKKLMHVQEYLMVPWLQALFYDKHLGLENRGKCLQFCFQISVNMLHVDGISVIFITVPRLFSLLEGIYITIM